MSARIVEAISRLSPQSQERVLALAKKSEATTTKERPSSEIVELMQRLEASREQSKNDISRVAARFFIGLISSVVAFIVLAPVAVAMGVPLDWKPASEALLEIIKIAVLPIVMLVLGFHFGAGQTSFLKDILASLLSHIGPKK